MTYPCEIIKDLLPLYIDGACSEKSVQTVEKHLADCEACKKYYKEMKETNGFIGESDNSEDMKMAESLKSVKSKINGKIKKTIIGAVAAVLILTGGFEVLFNAPIKSVDRQKVKITAEVYPFSELSHSIKSDGNSTEISLGEDDKSNVYRVEIPGTGEADVAVSEEVMKRDKFATVINASSDYFLKNIIWEIKDDVIYISAFKTTLLNNKAKSHQRTMTTVEFKEINKIVYQDGKNETVLWKR